MIPFEVIALSPYARDLMAEIASRKLLRRFRDAVQRVIEIRAWQAEDWSAVSALYDTFFISGDHRRAFPPLNAPQRASWLEELTSRGPNIVARAGNRIVGHAALVGYDGGTSHELVMFVHSDYRGAGIGGALLDALVQIAPRERVSRIWLLSNREAGVSAALYESRGFRRDVEHVPGRELWMLDVSTTSRWEAAEQFIARVTTVTRGRVQALLRAVRLVMIPLVCALIIAAVSGDTHGRSLALILAVASVIFGIAVEMEISGSQFARLPRRFFHGGIMAKNHGNSVKNDKKYEALRDKGYSKERSAKIANSGKSSSRKGGKHSH